MCLSLSANYVDLPHRVNVIHFNLGKREIRQYQALAQGVIEVKKAAMLSTKQLQFGNGAPYNTNDSGHWQAVYAHKLDVLQGIVDETCGQPVLVVYHFKSDKACLQQRFKNAIALDEDGAMACQKSASTPGSFCQRRPRADLESGGHIIVGFALNLRPALHGGYNARLYRPGQMKPVSGHGRCCRHDRTGNVTGKTQNTKSVTGRAKARDDRAFGQAIPPDIPFTIT